jgi:lipopolysaccharide-binding protein
MHWSYCYDSWLFPIEITDSGTASILVIGRGGVSISVADFSRFLSMLIVLRFGVALYP